MDVKKIWNGVMFSKDISRRRFLKAAVAAIATVPFLGLIGRPAAAQGAAFNGRTAKALKGLHDLVSVKGEDPYAMTVKAVEAMGGMGRFVKQGDVVVVKPNIGWDRSPAQAGNTNPEVVAALVDLSYKAGAKRVNVFDITCNDPRRCYESSGIMAAAEAKGAKVYFVEDWNMVKARFGRSSMMEGWPIFKDAIDCDVFINVPVLKHHGLTGLTLSMKNLMGVCGGERGKMHRDIGPKLVDLTRFIAPDLTVIDAYRVLTRNGPTGGNLADVDTMKRVLVATDPVLADTYAARMVNVEPSTLPYIRSAVTMGFGSTDIKSADIVEVNA